MRPKDLNDIEDPRDAKSNTASVEPTRAIPNIERDAPTREKLRNDKDEPR
jgi:hypothetical protein